MTTLDFECLLKALAGWRDTPYLLIIHGPAWPGARADLDMRKIPWLAVRLRLRSGAVGYRVLAAQRPAAGDVQDVYEVTAAAAAEVIRSAVRHQGGEVLRSKSWP